MTEKVERPPWSGRLFSAILVLILLAPFIHKAFHLDDPLFLLTAEQILRDPLDFYGTDVNWYGTSMPLAKVTKNPPLAAFLLAAAGAVFGWREIALHAVFLLPAAALAIGTFELARRFCRRPLRAVAITLLSPAVLVSSTNLMCDTLMAALWVWAIVLWREGVEHDRRGHLLAGALLAALAALTKYFGLAVFPLLALYAGLRTRRWRPWTTALLLAVAVIGVYQWHTHQLYGRGLLWDAAEYATAKRPAGSRPLWSFLIGLCFTGGGLAPALFLAPWLWTRKRLVVGALLAAALAAGYALIAPQGLPPGAEVQSLAPGAGVNEWLAVQGAVWTAVGIGVLTLCIGEVLRSRQADDLLLGLWIAGTFCFAVFVNWTINARSLLPLAPAAAILMARRMDRLRWCGAPSAVAQPERNSPAQWLAWGAAAALALAVAWADFSLAGAGRHAARRLAGAHAIPGQTLWFQGHWGFQYYMEHMGARPLDGSQPAIQPGEICIVPANNTNIHLPPPGTARLVAEESESVCGWASTLSHLPIGAGFYSSLWRPLPFAFGRIPAETYWVLQAVQP